MSTHLDRLASLTGIEPQYVDYWGRIQVASDRTKRELLAAMGFDAHDDAAAAIEADRIAAAVHLVAPVTSVDYGEDVRVALIGERSHPVRWRLRTENGDERKGDAGAGTDVLDLGALPLGYHLLDVERARFAGSSTIVVAPARAYWPDDRTERRAWGLTVQLYGLRSRRNWGIGDFGDLRRLCARVGAVGGSVVGVNPLHELRPHEPRASSPYSPSSRYWLNGFCIDVGAVPEYASLAREHAPLVEQLRAEVDALRDAPMVEYAGVARVKRAALEAAYRIFCRDHLERDTTRARAFRVFVAAGGRSLECLTRYEALAEHVRLGDPFAHGWRQWPKHYRSPESDDVERFARTHAKRVEFFGYLQFLADEQLAAIATEPQAHASLYRDLAVGCDLDGADAWSDQRTIVTGAALGAPPDPLNALGQNWGLPPFSPLALRAAAYRPFAELLRANMRHASVLRIDHAIGLMRGFWIPRGRSAGDGAYVRYDLDALLGIVALESQRNRCAVVGEDLGTVPEELPRRMHERGILSTRLVFFERSPSDGGFLSPALYPEVAAASVGSHDLAPIAGWWSGDDLAVRARLRLYPDDDAMRAAGDDRWRARFALIDALFAAGAIDGDEATRLRGDAGRNGAELASLAIAALHRFLARCRSRLVLVQLADLLGEVDAANLPGTIDEHPNWCRKRSENLESPEFEARLAALGRLLAAQEVPT